MGEKNMKVSVVMCVYDESIQMCRRAIENTRPIREELVVVCHTKLLKPIKEYLKKEASKLIEIDMDKSFPEEDKNLGLDNAKSEWIFVIDPDEFIDEELLREIQTIKEDCEEEFFLTDRINIRYWETKKLEIGVEYPDTQVRLFKRKYRWSGNVHEFPNVRGRYRRLKGNIIHDWLTRLVPECERKAKVYKEAQMKYGGKK